MRTIGDHGIYITLKLGYYVRQSVVRMVNEEGMENVMEAVGSR